MKSFVKSLTLILAILAALNSVACKISVDAKDPVTCIVTYKSQRASAPSAIQVKQNTVLTQSQLPELKSPGYIFMGWFDADTKAEPEKYKVKKDVTLTAGWEVDPNYVEYTVEFNSMGGSSVSKQTVEGGHKAKKPQDPAKPDSDTERFIFDNWYTSSDGGNTLSQTPFDFETPINANITLYAKWTITDKTYTVTYITKHGTAPQSIVVDKDAILTAEQLPVLDAVFCTFKGWFIDDVKVTAGYKVTKDITLTASWRVQKFTVTYETDLGTAPQMIQVEAATVLSEAQLPVLTLEGHVFSGWFDDSTKAEPGKYVVTGNVVLTGVWDSDTVTITYVNQNGTTPKLLVLLKNTSLTSQMLPSLTSLDYEFLGWYSNNDQVNVNDLAAANMTLTARWSRNYYTVTFNTKGGSSVDSQTIASGEKATRPDDPTKEAIASESYTFAGWYTSTDGGTTLSSEAFDFDTLIRAPVTLYAKWNVNPITYTVSFNSMGGTTVISQTVTGGQKATKPANPTKSAIVSESYSFVNWYTSTDGGQTLSSATFDFNTAITSNITLYAKWTATPITYTVTFNTMGGSTVTSQSVTGGQKATRPVNPTKTAIASESYSFVNWYTSTDNGQTLSSVPFDFNTIITSNITLYAKWTVSTITYTVIFNTMGGSTVTSKSVTGGQKATRPVNPTKTAIASESYSFVNWYTSTDNGQTLSSVPFDFNTIITSNITLYAKWTATPITYTVTFNTMGGSTVASQTVTGGQKATRPANPTKTAIASESYSFVNWYTSTDGGTALSSTAFDFNTEITEDINLYAKWTVSTITYTVTFNTMGGSTVVSQTVTGGQKATRPANPTKTAIASESYSFVNWYTSTDGGTTLSSTAYDFNTAITSNITLYAKWTATPITYTVTFNTMGGSTVASQTVTGGQKATKPTDPTKEAILPDSYRFAGWYTSTNGGQTLSSTAFDFNTSITKSITLYAKWTLTQVYTITFNTMGGSSVANQSVIYGEKATRPTDPVKEAMVSESYSFVGWYTSTNGGQTLSSTPYNFNIAITKDITLYAKWTATPIVYTVTFNTMGGSSVTSQTVTGGQKATRPIDPTKVSTDQETYYFFNWYTSLDGGQTLSDTAYNFNTAITSNITLYAKWTNTEFEIPLIFEFINSGTITITNPWSTLKYSMNGGALLAYTGDITAKAGDKICVYAQESENTSSKYMTINCSSDCYIYGNVMSLVTLNAQTGEWNPYATSVTSYAFYRLFMNNSHIMNHNEKKICIPATTLAKECYSWMFAHCISLTKAPDLPATTLADYCYASMFSTCISLTTAPDLPATTLAGSCYSDMFHSCSSLTATPVLPATILANYCYNSMFEYCTSLTTVPVLPATTLAIGCYKAMFSNCTSLTIAPNLPATILADHCYEEMFSVCKSLTTAPKLPATTLADYCYSHMLAGCTSLMTVPSLPATTLAKYCYEKMFSNCQGLTTAPKLSATILADYCCGEMFSNCQSLTTAPKLPATTLADYCYSCMFYNCISLTTAPDLPATTLATGCYQGMFADCTSLTTAPDLPVTTLAIGCYDGMFSGCTSLTTAPKLPATTLTGLCYYQMFYGCTSLTTAPKLPATTLANNCYEEMFYGCTSLTTAPILPATTLAKNCYSHMFYNCTSLTTVPDLSATLLAEWCCSGMFSGCTSLTTVPDLSATLLAEWCCSGMFSGCTSLTTAPKLPATTLADYCYSSMFSGCTNLTTAPKLPATTLAKNCYSHMFYNCTSLTTAPDLPATTLVLYCYDSMFYGCTNLSSVKCLANNISAYNCTYDWLIDVSYTGTFIKNKDMASWISGGYKGIPSGWTVQDAE